MENNKLTTFGMSPSDLGKALIEEAQNRNKKRVLDLATAEINLVTEVIDAYKAKIASYQKHLEINSKRYDAITAGEFELDSTGKIIYNDPILNTYQKGLVW